MINSPRDANRVPAMMVTSNSDGITPMVAYVNSSHRTLTEDGTTGSSLPFVSAERDANRIPVMWGISNADGKTIIPVYGNPATGAILIKST